MHPTKIIALNGAPRSGKDTAARIIRGMVRRRAVQPLLSLGVARVPHVLACEIERLVHIWGMSYALKEITHAMHGIVGVPHDFYEKVKDTPHVDFFGRSPRAAYIHVSEKMMKPAFGNDVFGRIFVRRLAQDTTGEFSISPGLVIVPDAGFAGEWGPVIERFGKQNILLVRIRAEGRGITFANDSRSYIELPGVTTLDVQNNKAGEDGEAAFAADIERIAAQWLTTRATLAELDVPGRR